MIFTAPGRSGSARRVSTEQGTETPGKSGTHRQYENASITDKVSHVSLLYSSSLGPIRAQNRAENFSVEVWLLRFSGRNNALALAQVTLRRINNWRSSFMHIHLARIWGSTSINDKLCHPAIHPRANVGPALPPVLTLEANSPPPSQRADAA